MKSAYTIFQPTQNIPTLNLQGSYSLAFQTSESRHSFRFNYRDLQRIANKPEYFELESNHYYLLDTPLPTEESRRIDQATFDLALIVHRKTHKPRGLEANEKPSLDLKLFTTVTFLPKAQEKVVKIGRSHQLKISPRRDHYFLQVSFPRRLRLKHKSISAKNSLALK
jgi:hypothetical protein